MSVAGHVKTLENGEGSLTAFTGTDTASVQAETSLGYVHNGRQSLKLSYQAGTTGTAKMNTSLSIPSGESWIGMWVYGDGSGNTLMATVNGQTTSQILLTALDFTGWQYVMAELPDGTTSLRSCR